MCVFNPCAHVRLAQLVIQAQGGGVRSLSRPWSACHGAARAVPHGETSIPLYTWHTRRHAREEPGRQARGHAPGRRARARGVDGLTLPREGRLGLCAVFDHNQIIENNSKPKLN